MNRTIAERVRCMRLNARLPKVFWTETINTASFIINRSPSSAINFKILEEVWSGRLVDYSSLKIFSCPAYVYVQSGDHSKLDLKSRKYIFLGFGKGVKGYRLWDPISKKTMSSKDVTFDEAFMLKQNEVKTCDESSQEKLMWILMRIVHPMIRVMIMILIHNSNKKNLIQLLKVERSGFTKHHRDMAFKTWLVLLS